VARALLVAAALGLLGAGCTFKETQQFEAFAAWPNGIEVTIFKKPTEQLGAVRGWIGIGGDVNPLLERAGLDTRCPRGTWEDGDRCAWNVLRAMPIEFADNPLGGPLEWMVGVYWADALDERNFQDFRDNLVVSGGVCLHVEVRNWGDWPIEWRTSDWDNRNDGYCKEGASL
jgi:hypothetical protein